MIVQIGSGHLKTVCTVDSVEPSTRLLDRLRYYVARSYASAEYWIRGNLVVFTRSAVTPPKVNRFG